ncbi:MAG: hypothetical protein AB7N71_10970 [Phycisphaerae bacterium]
MMGDKVNITKVSPDSAKFAAFVVCAAIGICVVLAYPFFHSFENGRQYGAFSKSADALRHYVKQKHEWPRDWESLSPSFRVVDPTERLGSVSELKDRVDINFGVDLNKLPQSEDWYIRWKAPQTSPARIEHEVSENAMLREDVALIVRRRLPVQK